MAPRSNSSRLETVYRVQRIMAVGYSGMGAWCLLHPTSVIRLCLTPQYYSTDRTTLLLMRCFGAQATTSGLLLGIANMTRRSFAIFGLSMIPYLAFNAWFGLGPAKGMFTGWLWLDFVGNLVFGLGSLYCAYLLGQTDEDKKCGKGRDE